MIKHLFPHWVLSIWFIIDKKWLTVMVRNLACLDSHAITSKIWGHVINWEIADSSSIRNTWEDTQSSFTCPLWLMHALPLYNMYDHIACTHNIGSCIMYWGCLNMMMVKPAISISHPAGTTCFHFEWLGFERAQSECSVLTASASVDPTNRGDLTQQSQLLSVATCLTAKNIWVKRI